MASVNLNVGSPRVLDIGFGTGLWAQDMADVYPNVAVTGIDLSGFRRIGYRDVFPNLTLNCPVDYNEDDWGEREASFDLAHIAMLLGSVTDWLSMYRKVMR